MTREERLEFERKFAAIYEEAYGEAPTADELAKFMDEAIEDAEEWHDAFEEEHGRPARSEEELNGWLSLQDMLEEIESATRH
jgi:hypothetical protein